MRFDTSPVAKLWICLILGLAGYGAAAGAPASYAIVGIGPGRAYHINEHGEVAGSITAGDGVNHAFTYINELNDLGTFGGSAGLATAVNSFGVVAGIYAQSSQDSHGVVYRDGDPIDIGNLGRNPTAPLAINNTGTLVGYSTTATGVRHAFEYANGKIVDIGTLGGATSIANSVNAKGVVAGWSQVTGGHEHAFIYTPGAGLVDAGVLPSGSNSQAVAINDASVAVGHATDAAGANHAAVFSAGKVEDLGLDGASETYAEDINNEGVIAGWANYPDGSTRGLLHVSDRWVDLNSLLPAGSGWTILTSRAINDAGQITGEAIDPTGATTIYLMSPAPFLSQITPTNASAGSGDIVLTLQGFGFNAQSQALFNGKNLQTAFVSPTTLTATLPASLLSETADAAIDVENPATDAADAAQSIQRTFHVTLADAPQIGALSMKMVSSGSQSLTMLIGGSNFQPGDTAMLDGEPLPTTLRSPTQLAVTLPSADLATPKASQIAIRRGSWVSNPASLAIVAPGETPAVHTFPAGLQFISAPGDYAGQSLTSILDEPSPLLVTWSASSNAYSVTPEYPSDTLHVGHGYWARFPQPVELVLAGSMNPGPSTSIPLAVGWNMIGSPLDLSVPLDSLQIVDLSGRFYAWRQAVALGLVASPLYSYDPGTNSYVSHETDTLDPYLGYWIRVTTACSVVVTSEQRLRLIRP